MEKVKGHDRGLFEDPQAGASGGSATSTARDETTARRSAPKAGPAKPITSVRPRLVWPVLSRATGQTQDHPACRLQRRPQMTVSSRLLVATSPDLYRGSTLGTTSAPEPGCAGPSTPRFSERITHETLLCLGRLFLLFGKWQRTVILPVSAHEALVSVFPHQLFQIGSSPLWSAGHVLVYVNVYADHELRRAAPIVSFRVYTGSPGTLLVLIIQKILTKSGFTYLQMWFHIL